MMVMECKNCKCQVMPEKRPNALRFLFLVLAYLVLGFLMWRMDRVLTLAYGLWALLPLILGLIVLMQFTAWFGVKLKSWIDYRRYKDNICPHCGQCDWTQPRYFPFGANSL